MVERRAGTLDQAVCGVVTHLNTLLLRHRHQHTLLFLHFSYAPLYLPLHRWTALPQPALRLLQPPPTPLGVSPPPLFRAAANFAYKFYRPPNLLLLPTSLGVTDGTTMHATLRYRRWFRRDGHETPLLRTDAS